MKLGALTLSALAAQAAALSFDGSLPAFHTHWSPKPPAIDVATAAEAAAVEATWLPTEAARDLKRKKWMKARAARRKEMLTEQEDQSPSFFLSLPAFASEATFTPPPTPRSPPPYSAAPPSTSMTALASFETNLFEFKGVLAKSKQILEGARTANATGVSNVEIAAVTAEVKAGARPPAAVTPSGGLLRPQLAAAVAAAAETKATAAAARFAAAESEVKAAASRAADASSQRLNLNRELAEQATAATAASAKIVETRKAVILQTAGNNKKEIVRLNAEMEYLKAENEIKSAQNATYLDSRERYFEASLGAAQTQEKVLRESLEALSSRSDEANARFIALQRELVAAIATVTKEAAESEEHREKLAKQCLQLQTEVMGLTATKTSAADERKFAALESAAAKAEAKAAADRAAEASSQVLILQRDLAEQTTAARAASASAVETRIAMEAQRSSNKQEIIWFKAELNSLKAELEILSVQNATSTGDRERDLEASLGAAQAQEKVLRESLEALSSRSDEANARFLALQQELVAAMATVTKKAAEAEEQREKLAKQCLQLQTEVTSLTVTNTSAAEDRELTEFESAAAKVEAKAATARATEASAQVMILQRELAEQTTAARADSASAVETRIAMEAQLADVNTEVVRLEDEMKSLKGKLESQSAQTAISLDVRERETKASLAAAHAQETDLREALAELSSRIDEANARFLVLQQELEVAKTTASKAAAESDEQQENLEKLCSQLQVEVKCLVATNTGASEAREWAELEFAAANAEAKAAAARAAEASAQVLQLQREKLEAEVESLKTKSAQTAAMVKAASEVAEARTLAELLRKETRFADASRAASAVDNAKAEASEALAAAEAATLRARSEEEAAIATEARAKLAADRAARASAHANKLRRALDSAQFQSRSAIEAQVAAEKDEVLKLQHELESLRLELATDALAAAAAKSAADEIASSWEVAVAAKSATEASLRKLEVTFAAAQDQEQVLRSSLAAANSQSALVNARVLALEKEIDAAKTTALKAAAESKEQREKLAKLCLQLQTDISGLKQELMSSAAERASAEVFAANATVSAAQARTRAEQELAAAEAQTVAAQVHATEASAQVSQLQQKLVAALTAAAKAASVANEIRMALEAQVAEETNKVSKLQADVEDFTMSLGVRVQELDASLTGAQQRERELRASLATANSENTFANARVTVLQQRLDVAQATTVTALAKSDDLNEKFANYRLKLEAEIEGLKMELATNTARRAEAEAGTAGAAKAATEAAEALARAKKSVASAEADSKAASARAAEASAQVSKLQRELAAALTAAAQAVSVANKTRNALEARVTAGTAKEAKLQAAAEALKSELVAEALAAASAKTASDEAVSSLKAQLAARSALSKDAVDAQAATTATLGSRIQELEASLAKAQEREGNAQKALAALSGRSDEVKARALTLQKELKEAQSSVATATAKSDEVRAKYARDRLQLEAEVEGLKADVADYAVGQAEAETAAAKAVAEVSAVRARSSHQTLDFTAKDAALKNNLEQARAEAAEARAELTTLRREAAEALAQSLGNSGWLGGLFGLHRQPTPATSNAKRLGRKSASVGSAWAQLSSEEAQEPARRDNRALAKRNKASASIRKPPRILPLAALFLLSSVAVHSAMGGPVLLPKAFWLPGLLV